MSRFWSYLLCTRNPKEIGENAKNGKRLIKTRLITENNDTCFNRSSPSPPTKIAKFLSKPKATHYCSEHILQVLTTSHVCYQRQHRLRPERRSWVGLSLIPAHVCFKTSLLNMCFFARAQWHQQHRYKESFCRLPTAIIKRFSEAASHRYLYKAFNVNKFVYFVISRTHYPDSC